MEHLRVRSRRRTGMAAVVWLLGLVSPAAAIDDVLLRHIETVLDFVVITSAACVAGYNENTLPQARAYLNFSQNEIAVYCACSTKLLIRQMDESDFKNIEAGGDALSSKHAPAVQKAHFDCAKKVWDARHQR